ncbi:hypothetical protein [Psychroserpens sp. SPM9]|uniref:hypothetical protein n=1 Tax=Psychroserpens sp. SPM9 TaxID=2975598 RepID=UPI0021A35D35|nr:hypothetical protein [Psychroserpens sp. SPM9]MDG5492034.1 hypothetical protein [Psychroserpens sp. SPM9]
MKSYHLLITIIAFSFTTKMIAQEHVASKFYQLIETMWAKDIPLNDTTNFDSFIEAEDYKTVDVKTLKLEDVYANFYKEGYNYKAIRCYKIVLSKDFYSVVVTVKKGDNEMESTLINYDLKGNIIDHEVVAYDEIAEGQSRIETKIERNKLTVDHILWIDEKKVNTSLHTIEADGIITKLSEEDILIDSVIKQLGLEKSKIHQDFVIAKTQPNSPNETIVVIPEIAEENEHMFKLNSYILLVNTKTGKITHQYFESFKTNGWLSHAVAIERISIDTAAYQVAKDSKAFGVRVFYYSRSQPNPYSSEDISLFVKSKDALVKVLDSYSAMEYSGAWDTRCTGEFTEIKNTFMMSTKKTNDYFDILVKSKITETKNHEDENGDCKSKEDITEKKTVLTFNGDEYN